VKSSVSFKRDAPLPLYYQIELRLREAIESGQYAPGQRLPTEKVLQQAYGVSRVTIRTALRRLEEDGLISTQRGRGTFVTLQADEGRRIERNPARLHSFEEEIVRQAGPPRIEVLAIERAVAPPRISALLGLPDETEVTRVRRVGRVGNDPLWIEARYIPPSMQESFQQYDLMSASFTRLIEAGSGLRADQSRLRITAAAATADQAKSLQIHPGDPVLINEFVVLAGGRPLEAARAVFRADRYAFTVEVFSNGESDAENLSNSFRASSGALGIVSQEVSS